MEVKYRAAMLRNIVLGTHVYEIQVVPSNDLQAQILVKCDNSLKWVFTIPAWGGISWGASNDVLYLWAALDLIILPHTKQSELCAIHVEDELRFVFYMDDIWVLVCETSVQLFTAETEMDRVEFGEVITHAWWDRGLLNICDYEGKATVLKIDNTYLKLMLLE
jgi:hypothetical protein